MAHSFVDVYIHLIWRTKYNKAVLKGDLEQFVHASIRELGTEMNLTVLAVNSAWDHVHSLYGWHASRCIDKVAGQLKGRISHDWNERIARGLASGPRLEWQVGYGAVSIRRSEITTIVRYIERQKQHHAAHNLLPDFETTRAETTPN